MPNSGTDNNFLAFDLGATSGRAVAGRISGGRLTMEEIYRFPNRILERGGRYYWDVYEILGHLKAAMKAAAESGLRITSIGIDTWGVDFGCIGEDGELLELPRSYRDPYTEGVPEEVFRSIPRGEFYSASGIQIMNFNTVFQLYALYREDRENGTDLMSRTRRILFMPDLLSYMLTGSMVCEYTDASTSALVNPVTKDFDRNLASRLGIAPSIFGNISYPGTQVGLLKPEIASVTGLGQVPVIAVAGHDTASAIAAVPAADGNFAYLSSGTWSLLGIEQDRPALGEDAVNANITNEGGIDGTVRCLKNITGMWLLEQCRASWAAAGRSYTYPELQEMAERESDFPSRINPDDPRFACPKDMDAEIRAALAGSGQAVPADDAQMVSCIYRSLADRYGEVLGMLRQFARFSIDRLHVIGGGSANDFLNRLTAESTGIPVVAGPVEATAIGNIMVQARAAGLVGDRWEMRRIIAGSFPVRVFRPSAG